MAHGLTGERYSLRRERVFVGLVALSMSALLAHIVHTAWNAFSAMSAAPPPAGPPPMPGVAYAPDAYRVAMSVVFSFLVRLLHPADHFLVNTGVDFCCAFATLMLLYAVAVRDFAVDGARPRMQRWAVVLAFLAAAQFPMAWVAPWQRPETMPSALFLAFALYCWVRSADAVLWLLPLFAAALIQGFVRADIAVIFGAGVLASGALGSGLAHPRSRAMTLATGTGVAVLAGGVQAYLQFVRFPHLSYPPGTAVLQWRYNLYFHNLQSAGVAILPFVLLCGFLALKRIPLSAVECAILASSTMYLALWFAVGIFGEVRIFVPYMLLLCVVAARVLGPWLVAGENAPDTI